jgi:hypothetical protein
MRTIAPALPLLTLILACGPLSAQTMTPSEATLHELRRASNAALNAGDVDAFMASIDADYVGTGGNGGHIRSRGELRTLIEGVAASPTDLYFVRTAHGFEVDDEAGRAMETGRWAGLERVAGAERPTGQGRYAAYWRRLDGAWVIHAEIFVTLPGADAPDPSHR